MAITNFDKNMSAVAFAEAGEPEKAREMMADMKGTTKQAPEQKKKPYLGMVIFGLISLSAYFFLFKNEKLVTQTFTMGGWHWVFPVGSAFFFSFVHGAFASNLLSVLGLEAKK